MIHQSPPPHALLRRKEVELLSGCSRSTLYLRINEGLWPRPVNLGPRSVAWPAGEVAAVNAARIGGCTDEEIKALVARLHAERAFSAARIGG